MPSLNAKPIDVTIVGGGMITNDLILPSGAESEILVASNNLRAAAEETIAMGP